MHIILKRKKKMYEDSGLRSLLLGKTTNNSCAAFLGNIFAVCVHPIGAESSVRGCLPPLSESTWVSSLLLYNFLSFEGSMFCRTQIQLFIIVVIKTGVQLPHQWQKWHMETSQSL